MKVAAGTAVVALFLSAALASAAPPTPATPVISLANSHPAAPTAQGITPDFLFSQGQFEQARAGYEATPKTSPNYPTALRQLGAIALYQSRLGEAEQLLTEAHARNPADKRSVALLAETFSREDKFAEMAQLLHQVGRPEREAEFALFGNAQPYRLVSNPQTVVIHFRQTNPLPAIMANVNDLVGLFLIDTGGPEIVLDPDFALAAHVQMISQDQRTRTPGMSFGRIQRFVTPGMEMADIPALITSTKGLSPVTRGKRVAGVIGTEFLSHFRPTIDYAHDLLILEPKDSPAPPERVAAEIPFWYVGDHFLLAPGRLDQGPKQLFLVNTGFSPITFTAPDSTLRDAGIAVPTPRGPLHSPIAPPTAEFPIARLQVGDLQEKNLKGIFGPFPPSLENGLGVHIGGIVSHGFFNDHTVTFDFVRMKITVRK